MPAMGGKRSLAESAQLGLGECQTPPPDIITYQTNATNVPAIHTTDAPGTQRD
jgi:hypothetical protein